jgi:tripartite ATP-independent transporter DctM subunit
VLGTIFILSFLVLIILRLPIAFCLGVSALIFFVGSGTSLRTIPQIMTTTFESFPLLAIPLFMLAGELMNYGGITQRLFGFAIKLVGHIKGGLAHVNIVANMIMAGMSGSAVADASGIGAIAIKSMEKEGFDIEFSAAITAAASTIGPIIPPSIPFVVFAATSSVSVGGLFAGGAIPGLLMGVFLMITSYILSVKRGYPCHKRASLREVFSAFWKALPPLLTPLIIIGGILSGIFTPTEAAGIAVFYGLILGLFIYRELKWGDVLRVFLEVAKTSSSIMIIISMASVFAYVLAYQGIAQQVADFLLMISTNKHVILLIINILLLIVGCFMEPMSVLLVLIPMLLPVVDKVGIDRLHFGVVAVLNLMIGLITPPVGVCLYVVAKIANISFERTVKAIGPFVTTLIFVLLLITYLPFLVTFLPNLIFK